MQATAPLESLVLRYQRVKFLNAGGARQPLASQINDIVNGIGTLTNLTVTEITQSGTDGRSLVYQDAFPTRYVFPSFSAAGTGNLFEEVTFKAGTVEFP